MVGMDKVRIGIIGLGGRGNGFARMFKEHPEAEVVGVAERNPERARRARKNLGVRFDIYEDYEDLLDRDDVDAIVVTTPDYLHREHAVSALEAGKHTLVDKPIATSVPDGLAILEEAHRSERVLCMGFNLRYVPVIAEAKRVIAEGRIGRPFFALASEYYCGGRTYMSRWNRLRKYSGGLFLHKGSHDFDILNWFNEPARPIRVSAFAGVDVLKPEGLPFELRPGEEAGPTCSTCKVAHKCPDRVVWYNPEKMEPLFDLETAKLDGYHKDLCMYMSDKDTYDNAVCIIEYDNGAKAFHSECFITPVSNRLYTVIGNLGHLEIDAHEKKLTLYPRWTRNCVVSHVESGGGGHGGSDPTLADSFIRSVKFGERPRAGAIDGVWSIAIACCAEISRDEKRVVEISEVLDINHPLLKQ